MPKPTPMAAPELAVVRVHGMTRGAFLLRAALGAGALSGTAAVTPFVQRALAQDTGGDVEILNFALTLEYLEAEFYRRARLPEIGLSAELSSLAQTFGDHERQHVDALRATIEALGGSPTPRPAFEFPMRSEADFRKLAVTLEDTGLSAYNGAATSIESREVLAAAGGIAAVEARHAAALRLKTGQEPSPYAFDKTLTRDEVEDRISALVQGA